MRYIAAAATDIGTTKKVNQDSLTVKIAQTKDGAVCMAVICDGLGGLSMGEVASANVVLAFDKWFREQFLNAGEAWTQERIRADWEGIVSGQNDKIRNYAADRGVDMGTTLTAALFYRDEYIAINVGDTRLYEIDAQCSQLTRDQTVVEREVEQGILTREQALTDSRRNILLQCIGVTQNLMPVLHYGKIKEPAAYLLCSDGFRHMVTPEEIYQMCSPQQNISREVMERNLTGLIERDKERGERDNISAILVQTGR